MKAGTVVRQQYGTLDGDYRAGLFVIIYDERLDYGIIPNSNLVGLKLTSTSRNLHYDVEIKKRFNPFLDHDSYVMCSKPHVLLKDNLRVLGHLTPVDLINVCNTYRNFNSQVDTQILSSLVNLLKGGRVYDATRYISTTR